MAQEINMHSVKPTSGGKGARQSRWCRLLAWGSLIFLFFAAPAANAGSAEFDGLIEPRLVVNVGSCIPGVLESVTVERGDMVKEGQVLASLQSGVEKATMELAKTRAEMETTIHAKKAELALALKTQNRYKNLVEKEMIPYHEWDEVETQRILAEFRLNEAIENKRLAEMEYKRSLEMYERTTICSPLTGVVVERFLNQGEYVEDQPVMTIAQMDPLYVEVYMTVDNLNLVKVGMEANVRPELPVGGTYQAKVIVVDKIVHAASGTFGVRLELPNPDYRLPPGLKCKVIFQDEPE
ncbi:MAG: efflux RND transporter periplasmic adaptor subunit [Desulfohalobiaceae bacterium]|nr:efflux RND transporter periplasmic adaptor subunit [Desulfohalobiaceae bacterium]